ncbi:DUF2812 domain-containing protein [Cellulosilyticum sp. I15G10I2]|uniref:DUF2812 domain-containing protein n=1 Tax=Cellulosilyticum sp. I15G10I2 TaxID=1892843 RepID=UPI00085CCCE4|nr:DUF2812 domain-containing protein [Cellulosilyticum sp. I15G10I2]
MGKIVKKILFEDSWQLGSNESWFSEMAASGLHLKSIGRLFAVFEKGEPTQTKYQVALLDEKPSQQEIAHCRAGGWQLAANRGKFYFFSSEESGSALESYIDFKKQKETVCKLERQLRKNLIVISVIMLIFLGMMCSVLFLTDRLFLSMVKGGIIQQILLVIVELYVFYTVVRNYMWAYKLKKTFLENKPLSYKARGKLHRLINGIAALLFLSITVFMVFAPIMQMVKSKNNTLPEAKTDLPIIRLIEVEQNPDLKRKIGYNNRGVDWHNRVSYDWSILAPIQLKIDEQGIVSNEMWEDNSGVYSPSIHTQFYQLAFNKMTDGFLQDLMKQYLYDPDITPKEIKHPAFDQIYITSEDTKKQIFASWDNKVIYIRYYGNKDVEHIISTISKMP